MKPSERRALQEAKRAQKIVELNEKESTTDNGAPEEPTYEYKNDASATKENAKPYKRREGFFQSNVRLITFIIAGALVLFVLGPLGIDMLIASRNAQTVSNKQDISINAVCAIYDKGGNITWDYFDNYNYTDYSDKSNGVRTREYPIKDSRLVLRVQGDADSNHFVYARLIDYTGNGDGVDQYIDVLIEDPRDFFEATMND